MRVFAKITPVISTLLFALAMLPLLAGVFNHPYCLLSLAIGLVVVLITECIALVLCLRRHDRVSAGYLFLALFISLILLIIFSYLMIGTHAWYYALLRVKLEGAFWGLWAV